MVLPVQVASELLQYCLADVDASKGAAAARQLAGLHIVPLLSGDPGGAAAVA